MLSHLSVWFSSVSVVSVKVGVLRPFDPVVACVGFPIIKGFPVLPGLVQTWYRPKGVFYVGHRRKPHVGHTGETAMMDGTLYVSQPSCVVCVFFQCSGMDPRLA